MEIYIATIVIQFIITPIRPTSAAEPLSLESGQMEEWMNGAEAKNPIIYFQKVDTCTSISTLDADSGYYLSPLEDYG